MEVKPINGFSRKLHPYQILSYFFFFILVASYFFLTFCLSRNVLKIVGGSLEFLLGITIVVSGYLSTAIDPSDSYLKASLKAKKANLPYNPPVEEYFCNIDYAYVHESSKHCKRCNRCTENFDHHCKWINNDVGKKNYKPFFVLITSVLFFLLVYLAMTIVLTVEFANDSSLPDNNVFLYNTTGKIRVAIIVLWVILAFSLVFLLLDLNLVLFHIFLIKKGLTTFQYIVLTEERKEQKREHERARRMMGDKKTNKTCLDFVLCLKKKKKKKPEVTQKPSQSSEHPENRFGQGNERANSQERQRSVVLEMADQRNNNEELERVNSQNDEPYSKLDVKENDTRDPDIIYKGEMIEENGNPLVVEDVNENEKKERIATAQSDKEKTVKRPQNIETNLRAENYRQSGGNMLDIMDANDPKKISPTFSSVEEFGERSARGYFQNKEILHKKFPSNGEDRKSREGPISIQILDEPDISHIKGKEPGSNVYNREHNSINSTAVGKENREGIGFKRRSVDGQPVNAETQYKEPYLKTEESDVLRDKNE